MKYTRNAKKSWEKQEVFNLENGWQVTVEWNQAYGEIVTRIEDKSCVWHGSDGLSKLPERFALARTWIQPIAPGHWQTIMTPGFKKD